MIDWQQVETVLLDMDGTLLDLHFDNYFWLEHLPKRYAEAHQVAEAQARAKLMQVIEAQRGSLQWYCVDYWSEQLDLDIEALKREVKHLIAVRPYALDFLRNLQQQGKRMVLVTNAHIKSLNLKLEQTEIGHYFDAMLCSHDFHCPKEDPAFWPKLQAVEPFDPRRTVFIDDTVSVLRSAEQYGIRYLLTVLSPDSKQVPKTVSDYPGFHHFDELLPQLRLAP